MFLIVDFTLPRRFFYEITDKLFFELKMEGIDLQKECKAIVFPFLLSISAGKTGNLDSSTSNYLSSVYEEIWNVIQTAGIPVTYTFFDLLKNRTHLSVALRNGLYYTKLKNQ